ncbi:transmembrane protein [Bacillus sp. JCM 19046]|nr:transmembrane protein [Bacillus sp. JCM 19045]GAF18258.1 transmembrane protein [Bacillus sp. JCM 19046]
MKRNQLEAHLTKLLTQRTVMLEVMIPYAGEEWTRPNEEKWSFGETYLHLYLLLKWFRRLNQVYLPIASKLAYPFKNQPYEKKSANVYELYQQKNQKAMKAPFFLMPPKITKDQPQFHDLVKLLDEETDKLTTLIFHLEDDLAGHIRYPDPLAGNPNLLQAIDLLGIHEQHHFRLCKQYYKLE